MTATTALSDLRWHTPEALVEVGLSRSRVVMVNEAHDRDRRCVRTRELGRRLLPIAHRLGVRHLAMEALWNGGGDRHLTEEANATRRLPAAQNGYYLSQPEMRALIQDALALGWTLLAYEMDFAREPPELAQRPPDDRERMARRERAEAQNLTAHVSALPPAARLLVWCGWSHLAKVPLCGMPWMACRFAQMSGVDPFCIDQTITVAQRPDQAPFRDVLAAVGPGLAALGGTAGLLADEAALLPGMADIVARADAFVFSLHNELE